MIAAIVQPTGFLEGRIIAIGNRGEMKATALDNEAVVHLRAPAEPGMLVRYLPQIHLSRPHEVTYVQACEAVMT